MTRMEFVDAFREQCGKEKIEWRLNGSRLVNAENCCPIEYLHDRTHGPVDLMAQDLDDAGTELGLSPADSDTIIDAADKHTDGVFYDAKLRKELLEIAGVKEVAAHTGGGTPVAAHAVHFRKEVVMFYRYAEICGIIFFLALAIVGAFWHKAVEENRKLEAKIVRLNVVMGDHAAAYLDKKAELEVVYAELDAAKNRAREYAWALDAKVRASKNKASELSFCHARLEERQDAYSALKRRLEKCEVLLPTQFTPQY